MINAGKTTSRVRGRVLDIMRYDLRWGAGEALQRKLAFWHKTQEKGEAVGGVVRGTSWERRAFWADDPTSEKSIPEALGTCLEV